MIISDDQISAKTIGKKTLEKGSKSLAKSAGAFIPFLLLLQFSLVANQPNHLVDLNSSVSLEMIWASPGTFNMGSPLSEVGRSAETAGRPTPGYADQRVLPW